jgi:hypothetical protein
MKSEMERLLNVYADEVEAAMEQGLVSPKTTHTYLYHPHNFVRWCKGEFRPGEKNINQQNSLLSFKKK